jgi:hypothetical protein
MHFVHVHEHDDGVSRQASHDAGAVLLDTVALFDDVIVLSMFTWHCAAPDDSGATRAYAPGNEWIEMMHQNRGAREIFRRKMETIGFFKQGSPLELNGQAWTRQQLEARRRQLASVSQRLKPHLVTANATGKERSR